VDRGFLARQGAELAPGHIPAVPTGEVTVTGRLRRSERGGHTTGGTPDDGTARLINGPDFAKVLKLDLYDGYLTVDRQVPANDPAFSGFPGPEIDNGPHFFYALQWFFFALLALGGLVYFSRQEARGDTSRTSSPGKSEDRGAAESAGRAGEVEGVAGVAGAGSPGRGDRPD
jgi:cytochrome oxidase assembly protein ShyY1